jgi:hypothetical protein
MCTLSIIPSEQGYLAGMNRDELLQRPSALPPATFHRKGTAALYPREPSGGTWIACNGQGNLLALLNWNELDARALGEKSRTRGCVIPQLIYEAESSSTDFRLSQMDLRGIFPFRLIGAFPEERAFIEWRWDGIRAARLNYPWKRRHWFSSSLSDRAAAAERGRVCEAAALDPAVGNATWLRSLHRSHEPQPGSYSLCVHRVDAATVSYTEVNCGRSSISVKYLSGSPCLTDNFGQAHKSTLQRAFVGPPPCAP